MIRCLTRLISLLAILSTITLNAYAATDQFFQSLIISRILLQGASFRPDRG
jgi:hypothetical protein